MKNRSLIFGIVVLVCSALVFSGCEQEADDDGGGAFTDITADNLYLKTDSSKINGYSNSLTIDSVIRDNSTGVVTITLSGTIVDVRATGGDYSISDTSSDAFWQENYNYDGTFIPAPGNYGAFVFDGAFPDDAATASKTLAVKTTNDALRYYKDATNNANTALEKPVTQNPGSIYIPESSAATRWRLWSTGAIPNSDWLSVLLWSGADPKRIELEIQEFASYSVDSTYTVLSKIVIDYSKVTFSTPQKAAIALAEKLEELGGSSGKATVEADGITVTLADDITIPAGTPVTVADGITLSVPTSKNLTVAGNLNVTGTLTVEGTLAVTGTVDATSGTLTASNGTITVTGDGVYKENVTTSFTLASADGSVNVIGTPEKLNAAALKEVTSSLTTVTVKVTQKSGPLTGTPDFTASNANWIAKQANAPDWTWADISVNVGSLFTGIADKVLSLKSTNHAYRYYAGGSDILEAVPEAPVNLNHSNIYIPTSADELPVKWKVNAANVFNTTNTTFGIILGSGVPSKIITIEIRQHTATEPANVGTDVGTVVSKLVIDYSGVNIVAPTTGG
jgi:hypothetical protein